MKQSLFCHQSYKAFLNTQIETYRHVRGYQGQMAAAAKCQPSFFSRVLRSDAHLTRDQAAELCRFWRLNAEESEYFIGLLDLERADSEFLKTLIKKRLEASKKKSSELTEAVQNATLTDLEIQMTYYSSWLWAAIHMATSISDYQTPPEIAQRLGLPVELVIDVLSTLTKAGLVEKKKNGKWVIARTDLHIPNTSPMNEVNHFNWRQRAILDIQKRNISSIHYSSVFAISRDDAEDMRKQILDTLTRTRATILPSKEEELYCLNCDFFEI